MELHLEKRCISAYVENQIGVLAKISGLFAGKNYNLDTLTVGETEDPTMSRMTIELTCDDLTYEQIIKQLNKLIEIHKIAEPEPSTVTRELILVKVRSDVENRSKIIDTVALRRAKAVDASLESLTIEATG